VLSDARRTTVRNNLVEGNGAGTGAPVCGICVAHGEHVSLVSNRVRGNGARTPNTPTAQTRGQRYHGGIVVAAPQSDTQTNFVDETAPHNVSLRRNVVEQPETVSAFVASRGACRITNNHFHSHVREGSLAVPTVLVFSSGKPWEAVDLPEGEPNPARWRQPDGSREYLNGRAQDFPDGDGGALCFSGNQIVTNGASDVGDSFSGFGALLVSFDHVSAVGNQFAARSPVRAPQQSPPHVLVVGLTADASANRVAEGAEQTNFSLAAMGAMMTAGAGNILTHCPAVFGCENHNDGDYFVAEDNLSWFRPATAGCGPLTGPFFEILRILCNALFGRALGVTRNPNIVRDVRLIRTLERS
jgi:hypothetical protein